MSDAEQPCKGSGEGAFRDRIATVDEQGKRVWIYPRKPKGRFYNARTAVSALLLTVLFAIPFVKIGGRPILLLNFIDRKFIIFGIAFWPQDFHLFALTLITFIIFIILFTAVFGRLFCGWACPQTVFMEMVFRKIEYLIEGDSHKQRQLSKAPWTAAKFSKKALKHAIFYAISFLIGNVFLSYIIGVDALARIVSDPLHEHVGGFSAMAAFSAVFYGVFAHFREQVCVIVCPYGRFQSVLLDRDSVAVSYDFKRGEPRGTALKTAETGALSPTGDCVDCGLCVEVCPTGIDIRDGTQLECVNCTACMDACDGIMGKLKRPLGLIRHASYNAIANGINRRATPRTAGYALVLCLLLAFVIYLLSSRKPIEATILRTPGMLYQELDGELIQNIYSVQIVNKSFEARRVTFHVKNLPEAAIRLATGANLPLPPDATAESVLFVRLPRAVLTLPSQPIVFDVVAENGEVLESFATNFKTPLAQ